jgi:hypothetical protein
MRDIVHLDTIYVSNISFKNSHGQFVVEEELGVRTRRLSVGLYMCFSTVILGV